MTAWDYVDSSGNVLATVSRPDVPPIGYPINMVGARGVNAPMPVREFRVVAVDDIAHVATLEQIK